VASHRLARSGALADEGSYELVIPENTNVSTAPVPVVAAALGVPVTDPAAFRMKPPPKRAASHPASLARRPAAARCRAASLAEQAPSPGDENQARDIFQLSPTTSDVTAPSVEPIGAAQSLGAPTRGLRSAALQVVEIASAIAGAAMTRVLDNSGDVSWELDQMPRDAVHPGGGTTSPSNGAWQRKTVPIEGFWTENGLGQKTFANFEVSYSYNGASVGYVEVTCTQADDAWAWSLTVKENMTQDPRPYRDRTTGKDLAAVKLRFHYSFDHSPASNEIGIQDLVLFGNGEYSFSERWTQS